MKMALYPCDPPPQTSWPQSNHEKNIRQIPIEGHPTNTWPGLPKTVKVIKNKGSLRNCRSQEELGDMTTKDKVVPEWDSGTEKGH